MPRAMSGLIALRRALVVCWGGCLCLSLASVVHAQGTVGSSSREAREDAMRTIPYRQLDPDARRKVDAVLDNVTVFRRMPAQIMPCDPDFYLFMVQHPDVMVDLWKALGISNLSLVRTGPTTFHGRDTEGSTTDIQFLYSSPELHLIYAVGTYAGGVFTKPINGGCLILLRSGYAHNPAGGYFVTSRMDAFFRVDHSGVEFMAKTFHPILVKSADTNFMETAKFFSELARVAEARPELLHAWSERMVNISAEDRRGFVAAVDRAAQRADNTFAAAAEVATGPDMTRVPPAVPETVVDDTDPSYAAAVSAPSVNWEPVTEPRGASQKREGRFQR